MMYNLQVLLLNRRPMQRLYRTPNSSQVLASEDSYQKKKKKKKPTQPKKTTKKPNLKICMIPVSQVSFAESSNHQTSGEAMLISH